ncbi:MAG: hypothetical protein D4R72_02715 [Nitrosopumilales archaeon]|nr:MAG: hypothetical protein D4R72_02715 [Nitrosopumilales archaeon]
MAISILLIPTYIYQNSEATPNGAVAFTIRGYENLKIQNGLTIQGNNYTLTGPINKVKTTTVTTFELVNIKLLMWDKLGAAQKKHVTLYMNLNGVSREIKDSDTYIIFDSGKPLQIVDPHKYFVKTMISTSNSGNYVTLNYDIVFVKSMQKSDLIISAWDQSRYVENTKVADALQVR